MKTIIIKISDCQLLLHSTYLDAILSDNCISLKRGRSMANLTFYISFSKIHPSIIITERTTL